MNITKEDALAAYPSGVALAEALGITPEAVYQWKAGEPIPEKQALKLRYALKPMIFGANSAIKDSSDA